MVQYNTYNVIYPNETVTLEGILTVSKNFWRCASVLYVTVNIPVLVDPLPRIQCHVHDIFSYKALYFCNLYLKHFKPFLSPFKCTIGVVSPQHTFLVLLWPALLLRSGRLTPSTDTSLGSEGSVIPYCLGCFQDDVERVFLVHGAPAVVWVAVVFCSSAIDSEVDTVPSVVLHIESGQ